EMSFPGIVGPDVAISAIQGLFPQSQKTKRTVGEVVADITIEEEGSDEVIVTEHPVENTVINDHSYKRPARVILHIGFSNSSAAAGGDPNYSKNMYMKLLDLQTGKDLISIKTGKRDYDNMVLTLVVQSTDQESEHALFATVHAQEIFKA